MPKPVSEIEHWGGEERDSRVGFDMVHLGGSVKESEGGSDRGQKKEAGRQRHRKAKERNPGDTCVTASVTPITIHIYLFKYSPLSHSPSSPAHSTQTANTSTTLSASHSSLLLLLDRTRQRDSAVALFET